MSNSGIRIGISAIFDPRITSHGRTLLRSVELFRNHCAPHFPITYEFGDDNADPQTAIRIAEGFVKRSVDVVVGHFSSDAAVAAAPIYDANGIPLLLPAATTSSVTENNSNAFRICPNDTALARRLLSFVIQRGWSRIHISSDESLHGKTLAAEIRMQAKRSTVQLTSIASTADALVFAGRLAASCRFVSTMRAQRSNAPIILTDDAASTSLSSLIENPGELHVLSFAPAHSIAQGQRFCDLHRLTYGADPDVYALEAFAALQIAADAKTNNQSMLHAISEGAFDTAIGLVRFHRGEREGAPHGLWKVENEGIVFKTLVKDRVSINRIKEETVAH